MKDSQIIPHLEDSIRRICSQCDSVCRKSYDYSKEVRALHKRRVDASDVMADLLAVARDRRLVTTGWYESELTELARRAINGEGGAAHALKMLAPEYRVRVHLR
jgi:hypothetical protein